MIIILHSDFLIKKFKDKNQQTLEDNWLEIKNYYQRFREWYEERNLYHKIGYLLTTGITTIKDLYNLSLVSSKTAFLKLLDEKMKNEFRKIIIG